MLDLRPHALRTPQSIFSAMIPISYANSDRTGSGCAQTSLSYLYLALCKMSFGAAGPVGTYDTLLGIDLVRFTCHLCTCLDG
jgi:hypothetical protein